MSVNRHAVKSDVWSRGIMVRLKEIHARVDILRVDATCSITQKARLKNKNHE